jgi:hypothetical protein
MVRDDIKTIYTGGLHMAIRDEILEKILKEYKNPEELIGKDGILNRRIASATAKRIFQRKTNIIAIRIRVAFEQGIRGHDLAGDAESALDGAVLHEGFLQRVQLHLVVNALGQPFDGDDGLAMRALGGLG